MVLLWFFSPPFLLGDCVCKDAGSDLRVRVSLGDDGGLQFPHDLKLHHPLAELSEHDQCSGRGKAALSLLYEGTSTRTIVQDTNNGPRPMEDPLFHPHFCPTTSKFSLTLCLSFEAPVCPRWVACSSVDMDLQFTECGADEQSMKLWSIVSSYTCNIVCFIQEYYSVTVSDF